MSIYQAIRRDVEQVLNAKTEFNAKDPASIIDLYRELGFDLSHNDRELVFEALTVALFDNRAGYANRVSRDSTGWTGIPHFDRVLIVAVAAHHTMYRQHLFAANREGNKIHSLDYISYVIDKWVNEPRYTNVAHMSTAQRVKDVRTFMNNNNLTSQRIAKVIFGHLLSTMGDRDLRSLVNRNDAVSAMLDDVRIGGALVRVERYLAHVNNIGPYETLIAVRSMLGSSSADTVNEIIRKMLR